MCASKEQGPAFSTSHGPELWVILLEKAYAKINQCFANIEAGQEYLAMRDITGAPGIFKRVKDPDEIFDFLLKCEKKKYLMTAGTPDTSSYDSWTLSDSGIIAAHAYGILDVRVISTGEKLL